MSFSRRRVTIVAGLGCCTLVLLAVVVLWKEILTQYHLVRLRRDPGYLLGSLGKPEGSLQMSAVREFLDAPEGRAALIRHLLEHVRENEWRSMAASTKTHTFVVRVPQSLQRLHYSDGYTPILCEDDSFFEDTSRVYEVGMMPATLNDLMGYLVGRSVSLPEYPGMTFLCHDLETWQQYLRSRRE